MQHNNTPPPKEVVLAYARKTERLSMELEKLARVSCHWMDHSVTKELWQAQNILYQMAKRLKDQSGFK